MRSIEPVLEKIVFNTEKIDPKKFPENFVNLFDRTAKEAAEAVAEDHRVNKPTQLRRFYDEIIRWDQKSNGKSDDQFLKLLPLIRMINAKAAYAKGRNLMDDNYVKLLSHCLGQVNTPKEMRTFKTFMEAFTGFYKAERPKDS